MKTQQKKLPNSQVELEIEIPAEEFDAFVEKAVFNLGQNMEIEGFRRGKAPKEIVEKKIGEQKILMEAADLAVKANYAKAIEENKLEPISQPEISVMKLARSNPFVFKAKFYVLPEIKLPDYKKIAGSVKKQEISVPDNEVEQTLEWLRRSRAKFTVKNEAARKGDFVEIEYNISTSDNPVPSQEIKDGFILGDGHLLGDFEKEIMGMKSGEEKEFFIDVSENHRDKNAAGKKVHPVKSSAKGGGIPPKAELFNRVNPVNSPAESGGVPPKAEQINRVKIKAKMKSVQNVEFPQITDEFAKSVGNFKDLADLKRNIKESILEEKKHQESHRIRDEIVGKIGQETNFELPDFLIEQEKKRILAEFKNNVSQNLKISFEDYLKQVQKTEEEFLNTLKPQAENRVKNYLILRGIQLKENILVSAEEIEKETNRILNRYSDVKATQKEFDPQRLKIYTEDIIKEQKVFKFLESFVK